jgi:predicted acetyltransferase
MEIRNLREEEFEQSTRLSEYAFQYKMTPERKQLAKERFKPEQVWGIFDEDEQLAAKLVLIPFTVSVQGETFPMGGIASVSTWPENRRQGYIKHLLTHALQQMNENGQVFSMLHPFSYPFYRKYGWEMFSEYKKYVISTDKLPAKVVTEGAIRRDIKDVDVLDTVYAAFSKRYNGLMVRTREWWTRSVLDEDGHTAVYYSASGAPEGYVLYKVENKEFTIDELVYVTDEARRALWTYIANHDSMVTQLIVNFMPMDDSLTYHLADPRINQEIIPYGMARVVNMKKLVEAYPFTASGEGGSERLTIRLTDMYAPWNEGVWSWSFSSDGTASVSPLDSSQEQQEEALSCDIQALTVMLTGFKRPAELYQSGRIAGGAKAVSILEARIPARQTLFMDFF